MSHADQIIIQREAALRAHMATWPTHLLKVGTWASSEFDRLYTLWIQARWDAGDAWVRSVWTTRPAL